MGCGGACLHPNLVLFVFLQKQLGQFLAPGKTSMAECPLLFKMPTYSLLPTPKMALTSWVPVPQYHLGALDP